MQQPNVAPWERLLSVTTGSALIAYGLMRRSWPGSLLALIAGAPLLYRGSTGHCPVYGAFNISTANQSHELAGGVSGTSIHIAEELVINRPVAEVFRYWSNFENLPRFMDHLESVKMHQNGSSHWVAKAPLGTKVEWDADIVDFDPNQLIRWRSRPGTLVPNEGSVKFTSLGEGETSVRVNLDYHPPAGVVGAAIARMFGEDPRKQVSDDLRQFKDLIETPEIPVGQGVRPPAPSNPAPSSEQHVGGETADYKKKLKQEAREHKDETLEQPDSAVDLTFPASDPPAW